MSDLMKAFAGMKQAQEPERPDPLSGHPAQAPKRASTQGPKLVAPHSQGTAKSTNPEYTPVKVFLRRQTHKAATRRWEDAEGGDFSDLVEQLLRKYLDT